VCGLLLGTTAQTLPRYVRDAISRDVAGVTVKGSGG